MHRPSRLSLILASVAAVAGLAVVLPTHEFNMTDARIWIAGILFVIAIVIVIGGAFGAGAEVGLHRSGRLADAEVLELKEERRRWKGETITVWVARVRYQDASGAVQEGIIDDCNEYECERLKPGTWTKVKYNEKHPEAFVWTEQPRDE